MNVSNLIYLVYTLLLLISPRTGYALMRIYSWCVFIDSLPEAYSLMLVPNGQVERQGEVSLAGSPSPCEGIVAA